MLQADTWFYAKRCLLALLEMVVKHMLVLKDQTFTEVESPPPSLTDVSFLSSLFDRGHTEGRVPSSPLD